MGGKLLVVSGLGDAGWKGMQGVGGGGIDAWPVVGWGFSSR